MQLERTRFAWRLVTFIALASLRAVSLQAQCTTNLLDNPSIAAKLVNIDGTSTGFNESGLRFDNRLENILINPPSSCLQAGSGSRQDLVAISVAITLYANVPDAQPNTSVSLTIGTDTLHDFSSKSSSASGTIPKGSGSLTLSTTISTSKQYAFYRELGYLSINAKSGCYLFVSCLGGPQATYSVTSAVVTWTFAINRCSLSILSGNNQTGFTNYSLHDSLATITRDDTGWYWEQGTVTFSISPSGIVGPNNTVKIVEGKAAIGVVLGAVAGEYTITATQSEDCSPKTVTFTATATCTTTPTITMFDPVPPSIDPRIAPFDSALVSAGNNVVVGSPLDNPLVLKNGKLRPIKGVSADGVTQAVFRLKGCAMAQYAVSLFDENGNAPNNYGDTVGDLSLPQSSNFAGTQLVTTDIDGFGAVVYRAPSDFPRSSADAALVSREVELRVGRSGQTDSMKIKIGRPPVLLVHGLWGSLADWKNFTALTDDPLGRFFLRKADYDLPVGIFIPDGGTTPEFKREVLDSVRGAALGFSYGANEVLNQTEGILYEYRVSSELAATTVDVVSHSMGGVVARTMEKLPQFYSLRNYRKGLIHKLITIGTPHLGSPLATELLTKADGKYLNYCIARTFAENDLPPIETVKGIPGVTTGGVNDLRPGSPQIQRLQVKGKVPLLTAMIYGEMSASQLAGLDSVRGGAWTIKNLACLGSGNPARAKMNSTQWPILLGGGVSEASDGIVPSSSARNGRQQGAGAYIAPSSIHSEGTSKLGFGLPHLLQASTPGLVVAILNIPISTSSTFKPVVE